MIKDNLRKVLESITICKEKYNLKQNIRLVAVSKYSNVSEIFDAFLAGQFEFGENKVQDLVRKYETFSGEKLGDKFENKKNFKDSLSLDSNNVDVSPKAQHDKDSKDFIESKEKLKKIKWHFIGHLQENKINSLLNLNIELLHSLHSINLANALQKRLIKQNKKIKALLQVNSANEDSKQGFEVSKVIESYLQIKETCPNILLNGLMCMGANTNNVTLIDKSFNITNQLFDEISKIESKDSKNNTPETNLDSKSIDISQTLNMTDKIDSNTLTLSMGMSSDYEIALKNGSNCLRLGSIIFK
ncbi:YggS family pyridoxal phosphate enzyme [Helicobacter saguini]|uniref:Pyridoxal phosphate homeostasis protein n=1 Tax=Helicobacter saguini TaxID=1548018 RepID=A0A347VN36_9HELI|nr:alanine racemase [Helicobacter saguini]MWV61916.1 YggS family pyridoxal phosphate enzyme [Helicobacter saguini]MWV67409.1 YggS family pyridoxal phosphate enzyme [Helicobacter saguini]MWV69762.1 YggS family pyridoxal phosphate enzyme [Helicobacter saguini]MWV73021.1 YggS family pyridoxal phosphate enzyme [Helicobacter saguini]TLD95601.1 YggS family pyridoxal phosphate enzyme [Helicobacter saguini]